MNRTLQRHVVAKAMTCRLLALSLTVVSLANNLLAETFHEKADVKRMHKLEAITEQDTRETPYPEAGKKAKLVMQRGDSEFVLGGRIKIEHFFDRNAYLLNRNIPDELEYFKHTSDLYFDYTYGKKRFGYVAGQAFIDLRNKGIWGKSNSFANRDSGPGGPSGVKFSSSDPAVFGFHSHSSGKNLIWMQEAWIKLSPNAIANSKDDKHLHYIKIGWQPFDLGRGIALGGFYGVTKQLLGFSSYGEDKCAPGILLDGTIIKDYLSYDLYFGRFEERSQSFTDTMQIVKRQIVGRAATPWRGIDKDNDVVAARLKWKPLHTDHTGELDLQPFVFYNAASDQAIDQKLAPDSKINWGSYGLNLEYEISDFEFGGEVAFNYGKQYAFNIDRNQAVVVRNAAGAIVEQYNKVFTDATLKTPAPVTQLAIDAAQSTFNVNTNGQQILNRVGQATGFYSGKDRYRPAYANAYEGWMGVVDAAYTFEACDLKLAAAYGYASGDADPNQFAKDKKYKGFIGLHELYNGKRVKSIFILDERLLRRPTTLVYDPANPTATPTAQHDTSFTDLQHVGGGLTWAPENFFIRDLSMNFNVIGFWKAFASNKVVPGPGTPDPLMTGNTIANVVLSPDKARTFMGIEYNLLTRASAMTDLSVYANFALFTPGGYFNDIKGTPLDGDIFAAIIDDEGNDLFDPGIFRFGTNTAFHMNIGVEYKF